MEIDNNTFTDLIIVSLCRDVTFKNQNPGRDPTDHEPVPGTLIDRYGRPNPRTGGHNKGVRSSGGRTTQPSLGGVWTLNHNTEEEYDELKRFRNGTPREMFAELPRTPESSLLRPSGPDQRKIV